MVNRSISLLVKVQALTLTELAGFTNVAASEALNHLISAKQISRLRNLAKERGFDRRIDPELYDYYPEDRPRTGRPLKYTEEQDNAFTKLAIENAVSRELKAQDIADIAKETFSISVRPLLTVFFIEDFTNAVNLNGDLISKQSSDSAAITGVSNSKTGL
jgi:hypothetical protein